METLTLLIPAKKEMESLPAVLKEIEHLKCKKKIILEKNDIETINSIKNYDCEIIYQTGKGYGDALINGIKSLDTELFCIFNADGSFNPKEILQMISKLNEDKLDIIFASRYQKNSGSDDDTVVTLIGNFIFTKIGNIFFNLPITDILYTYVLCKTNCAKKLNLVQKDFSFCVELPIKATRKKMNISSISSHERERLAGIKKVNAFKDGFLILKYMIYLFFKK